MNDGLLGINKLHSIKILPQRTQRKNTGECIIHEEASVRINQSLESIARFSQSRRYNYRQRLQREHRQQQPG